MPNSRMDNSRMDVHNSHRDSHRDNRRDNRRERGSGGRVRMIVCQIGLHRWIQPKSPQRSPTKLSE